MSKKSVSVHAQIDHNLLAFIAHETRGPFNGLIGFSELLYTNKPSLSSEQQKNYTELVHQLAVKSFLQLQTLISWIKLISNNLVIHPSIISIEEWIESIIVSMQVDFSAKNIQVNTHISSLDIKGDQQLLSIGLANLLYAALRHSDENSEILIELDQNKKSISITINYNETFDNLLKQIIAHPDANNQTEQNFRIWIAYQIFSRHGFLLKTASATDKTLLTLTLPLS